MDSLDFVLNLLSTLIGVLIGIPAALWIDRLTSTHHQREDAKRILTALNDELQHNLGLLKQMKKELRDNVIFYDLDLGAWQAITSKGLESIQNYDLVRRISSVYYEYQHMNRKIDVQFQMHYSPLLTMPRNMYEKVRASLINPTVKHASQLEVSTNEVIEQIKKELEKLKKDP